LGEGVPEASASNPQKYVRACVYAPPHQASCFEDLEQARPCWQQRWPICPSLDGGESTSRHRPLAALQMLCSAMLPMQHCLFSQEYSEQSCKKRRSKKHSSAQAYAVTPPRACKLRGAISGFRNSSIIERPPHPVRRTSKRQRTP